MKVKLLKKIRKEYSIMLNPYYSKYTVDYDTKGSLSDIHGHIYNELHNTFNTIQEAKEAIQRAVYSRFDNLGSLRKKKKIKVKVWYI